MYFSFRLFKFSIPQNAPVHQILSTQLQKYNITDENIFLHSDDLFWTRIYRNLIIILGERSMKIHRLDHIEIDNSSNLNCNKTTAKHNNIELLSISCLFPDPTLTVTNTGRILSLTWSNNFIQMKFYTESECKLCMDKINELSFVQMQENNSKFNQGMKEIIEKFKTIDGCIKVDFNYLKKKFVKIVNKKI